MPPYVLYGVKYIDRVSLASVVSALGGVVVKQDWVTDQHTQKKKIPDRTYRFGYVAKSRIDDDQDTDEETEDPGDVSTEEAVFTEDGIGLFVALRIAPCCLLRQH